MIALAILLLTGSLHFDEGLPVTEFVPERDCYVIDGPEYHLGLETHAGYECIKTAYACTCQEVTYD